MTVNNNLSVIISNTYGGMNIQQFENGSYEEYLCNILQLMNYAVNRYSKVLAVRVDLRLPDDFNFSDTHVITRFNESLKSQLHADYLKRSRASANGVHASELFGIWVKEVGVMNKPHYHLCLFFNGNAYSSLGNYELGRDNMFNRIHKAWASALKGDTSFVQGLVSIPYNPCYRLNSNAADFEVTFRALFYRLSYFAKVDTKLFGDGSHCFGCSRIPSPSGAPVDRL